MALKAKDGTPFSNQMGVNHHNARMAAGMVGKMKAKPDEMDQGTDMDQGEQKSITEDPIAMGLVERLKKMGYTGEDVEQAMGDQEMDQSGSEATQAAPMQIPGTR